MRKYYVQLEILLLAYELLHNTLEVSWTALTTMKTQVNSLEPMDPGIPIIVSIGGFENRPCTMGIYNTVSVFIQIIQINNYA